MLISHSAGHKISFGTCIVAVITPDEIIIGADSLRNYSDGTTSEVCKIRRVGGFVFAIAGVLGGEDNQDENSRFCTSEIISEAIKKETSMGDAMNRIERDLERELTIYLRRLPIADQDSFLNDLKRQSIEVILCGVENGYPQMSAKKFCLKSPFDKIDFDIDPTDYSGAALDVDPMREHVAGCRQVIQMEDAINPGKRGKDSKKRGDWVSYVRDSINILIEYFDKHSLEKRWVGPPIRIVRITKSGIILEQ